MPRRPAGSPRSTCRRSRRSRSAQPLISIETGENGGKARAAAKPEAKAKSRRRSDAEKTAGDGRGRQEKANRERCRAKAQSQSEESLKPVEAAGEQSAAGLDRFRESRGATIGEDGEPAPAGPAVRRFARELGVDLHRVTRHRPRRPHHARGRDGRGARKLRPAARRSRRSLREKPAGEGFDEQDAYGKLRREPLTKIRKTIAANMARSHSTIPHVTNFDDADITELERIRKGSMADYVDKNVKLTMMAFVMKAVAHALKLHPAVNASLDLENGRSIYKQYVNLGVAVDTERGLVVPVMRDVDRMSIPQIAQALTKLAEKARNNQFSLDDLRGGTFTISNLGAIGGTYSTPIINHPEVAILLVGRSRKLPVVIDDADRAAADDAA